MKIFPEVRSGAASGPGALPRDTVAARPPLIWAFPGIGKSVCHPATCDGPGDMPGADPAALPEMPL
ncbi:hypothetical protein Mame01_19850 [Microbispora amethystogenes]|nr:hypothetical protein Mame01_19850 [Microbispora amethystogenes]